MSEQSFDSLVSIIIPCWNAEEYVCDAIESALGQTYPNVEVIVIDDGSTDGSLDVIKSFGDKIRWESGENRGGSAARNRGVAIASGEYIQFLDADDILLPEKVELCMEAHARLDDNVIPVTDWSRKQIDCHQPNEHCSFPANEKDVLSAVLSNGLQTAAPLHLRSTFETIGGFREHLKCSQEKDLHLRLVAAGNRFYRVPKSGVLVRQTTGSVSSSNMKVLLQRFDVYDNLAHLLDRDGALSQTRKQQLAEALTRDAYDICRDGRFEDALRHLSLASQLDPVTQGRGGLYAPLPLTMTRLFGVKRGARYYASLKSIFRLIHRRR